MGPRHREWGVVVCCHHHSWGLLVELVECGGGRTSPLMGGGDEPSSPLVGSGGGPSPPFALQHCLACRCPACPCPCVPLSLCALVLSCRRYHPSLSSLTLLVLVDPHHLRLVCGSRAVLSFLGCVVVHRKRQTTNPSLSVVPLPRNCQQCGTWNSCQQAMRGIKETLTMDGDDVERRHCQTTLHHCRRLRRMMVVTWKDVG
jgi:hypothetical protein